jgi:hypothetical protein
VSPSYFTRTSLAVRAVLHAEAVSSLTLTRGRSNTQKGAGAPLLSIHGAGGGFDQGLANAAEFVDEAYTRAIAAAIG